MELKTSIWPVPSEKEVSFQGTGWLYSHDESRKWSPFGQSETRTWIGSDIVGCETGFAGYSDGASCTKLWGLQSSGGARPILVAFNLKERDLREAEISESRMRSCVKKLSYVVFSISILTLVQPLEKREES